MLSPSGLRQRARLIQALRRFFIERGYLEVDTPVRVPAPAPEAYIIPEPSGDWFLQTSPELCMKRLLAGGAERIFQICKCFRQAERGSRHLPEFTMLEWYRAGIGYRELMPECEELFLALARELTGGDRLETSSGPVSLAAPWERLTVAEAFARHAPLSAEAALAAGRFDELLVTQVEPRLGLGRPTFLHDYPAALGALARLRPDDPAVAERFEIYVDGLELANGFSELTDPAEQRRRFAAERQRIEADGRRPGPLPDKFLAALAAMPEAAGIALGVDRLLMLLAGAESIERVVTFTPEEL
ncbi:MAG: EF-P lysine aminoacylase EpmA [Desulfobacteraceae bacterium]|nr:EF-P lysine aminoacylase EpmA [Desulfobacteraceae bacterium]